MNLFDSLCAESDHIKSEFAKLDEEMLKAKENGDTATLKAGMLKAKAYNKRLREIVRKLKKIVEG